MKHCRICGLAKSLEHFAGAGDRRRRGECNSCRSEMRKTPAARAAAHADNLRRKAKQAERRARLDAVKLAAGCVDCGYREHAVALDFDHALGAKVFGISYLAKSAMDWEVLETEIAKCEVVCANCHRVRTKARGDWTPRGGR